MRSEAAPVPHIPRRTPWPSLVTLILLAFVLRLHHLGDPSLRGDEAFSIRYWAQSPAVLLQSPGGLAWVEPHPFGTLFSYWAWKTLVGDSEFAMRMLPALVNLVGVPAIYGFSRRLLHSKSVALIAAFLWAVNPNLIWHSQDARDYAMWAAISVLSFWLLLSASDRGRRIDWLLYILSATVGLYVFFVEIFIVAVHGLYILAYRRGKARDWFLSAAIIAILLIPWVGQLWALAHSGYQGTATGANLGALVQEFLPALLFGENLNSGLLIFLDAFVVAGFIVHFVFIRMYYPHRAQKTLLLYSLLPTVLLVLAATRLNVFRPRYLIAISPALLLPLANSIAVLGRALKRHTSFSVASTLFLIGFLLGPIAILTADALSHYSDSVYHNPIDWKGLRAYLNDQTTADDAVIVTSANPNSGSTDPALGYYYPHPIYPLPFPNVDTNNIIAQLLQTKRSVWFIPAGQPAPSVNQALAANGMLIERQQAGSFEVLEYRSRSIRPGEIATTLNLAVGGGRLNGFTLTGGRRTGSTLSILLYWQTPPASNLKAFVHLIGVPKPDGSSLWAQDDHMPAAPGRDVYLIDLSGVPAGTYSLEFGLYNPKTNQREPITDGTQPLGSSAVLTTLDISS